MAAAHHPKQPANEGERPQAAARHERYSLNTDLKQPAKGVKGILHSFAPVIRHNGKEQPRASPPQFGSWSALAVGSTEAIYQL